MHPFSRLALSVGLALAMWAPTGRDVIAGHASPSRALVMYAAALFLARFCVEGFDLLVRRYRAGSDPATASSELRDATDTVDDTPRRRRRSDLPGAHS
jgi:hypothetical protein